MIGHYNRRKSRYLSAIAALAATAFSSGNDVLAEGAQSNSTSVIDSPKSAAEIALEGDRLLSAVLFAKRLEGHTSGAVCEQTWQDVLARAHLTLPLANKAYRQLLDERSAYLVRNGKPKLALALFSHDIECLAKESGVVRESLLKSDVGRIASILKVCNNEAENLDLKEKTLVKLDGLDRSAGAELHKQVGDFYFLQFKFEKALSHFQSAADSIGNAPAHLEEKASIQLSAGQAAFKMGQFKRASLLAGEAYLTIEKIRLSKRSSLLTQLAALELNINDIAKARRFSQEAFDCLDASASASDLFASLYSVGSTLERSGEPQNAIRAYKRCVDYYKKGTGDPSSVIGILVQLARLQRNCGDLAGAESSTAMSYEIANTGGDTLRMQCINGKLYCLGIADRAVADEAQSELLALARRQKDKSSRLQGFCNAVTFRLLIGDLEGAETILSEARAMVGPNAVNSSNSYDGVVYMRSGQVASARRKAAEAHSYFSIADKIFSHNRTKLLANMAQNYRSWGICYWLSGDEAKSSELRKKAFDVYVECGVDARAQLWATINWYFTFYPLKPQAVRSPKTMSHLAVQCARDTFGTGDSAQFASVCLSFSDLLKNAGYAKEARPFLEWAVAIRESWSAERAK
ncbi:MAG: hypothetical protein K2X93_28515 [Candidatus Obscuribacterales bacterium]|nr:hypothetical protein [Candidatus Obscuribacterales bacterium]